MQPDKVRQGLCRFFKQDAADRHLISDLFQIEKQKTSATTNHGRCWPTPAKARIAAMLHAPEKQQLEDSLEDQEQQYWSLLKSTQSQQYPGFMDFLSNQDGPLREEGRAAMIEFTDTARPLVEKVRTSRGLRDCLDEPNRLNAASRRLFIIEGLPRNFIQVLGARLRVPPEFFSAHWADSGSFLGNLVNRTPRHYDHRNQFLLSFVKMHWVKVESFPEDSTYLSYSLGPNSSRQLYSSTIFGDFGGPLTSWEQVSFWSVSNGESWDAVILVDPPLGSHILCKDSIAHPSREVFKSESNAHSFGLPIDTCQQGSWYPFYHNQSMLSPECKDLTAHHPAPRMESLFDDIVLLYPLTTRGSTADVRSCIDICRRLVLSACTARLRVIESQIAQERTEMSMEDPFTARNTEELFHRSWTRAWKPKDFGRLVRATTALESIEAELERNLDALGVNSPGSMLSPWEADAWRNLLRSTQLYKSRVDGILQTYMQAISVRQSISSGQLTSMATIFIPVSLVAAVFSMGGKFAAGESLFWVFWVIAILVASIGCILLYTKIGRRTFRRATPHSSSV